MSQNSHLEKILTINEDEYGKRLWPLYVIFLPHTEIFIRVSLKIKTATGFKSILGYQL